MDQKKIDDIFRNIRFGVDYYPEHWPRERWEQDANLMQKMGIQVVRMGEFSWHKMEPEQGKFDFEWLVDAADLLGHMATSAEPGVYREPTSSRRECGTSRKRYPANGRRAIRRIAFAPTQHHYTKRTRDCRLKETTHSRRVRGIAESSGRADAGPRVA